jgi:hypothetical protein
VLDDGVTEVGMKGGDDEITVPAVGCGPLTHPRESHTLGSAGTDTPLGPCQRIVITGLRLETRRMRAVSQGQPESGVAVDDCQPCKRQKSPFE